ncbi:MAG TPA: NAD(P)-dependent oxidoreductase, partial [Chloroflexota bacterium]|nr:NAD(P)-dependent oxidoreductase [Chloroflexota bacterium]
MKVLVAGATGFVAGHVVPQLLRAGHEVIAAGHDPARLARLEGAEPVVLDLRARELAPRLPARIDAVLHLAQANVPFPDGAADLFEVNVGSTQRLLEYARQAGAARFVYTSTGSVYGGGERPWREDDRAEGTGYYAATRQAAERLVHGYGELVPSTILRLFVPYGPGQRGRLVPNLIERVRDGRPVSLREGGRPRFNPIFVAHVAEICAQALGASSGFRVPRS